MRPVRIVQDTVDNTVVPMDWTGGPITILALPSGAGNYDVAFTTTDIFNSSLTPIWEDITNMSAATDQQSATIDGSITGLRITLNSGTDVTVDISQSDT